MVKLIKLLGILSIYLISKLTFAGTDLSIFTAPKDMKNLHVTEISSNEASSEFVIFIRNEVQPHLHQHHTELVYVIEGEGLFHLGETKQMIKAGDFIKINKNTPHSVIVTSDIPLKVLSIQTPKFEGKDRVFVNN
ncbi:cupin domain-containing protein [Colwelliaceae bacterium 6441]